MSSLGKSSPIPYFLVDDSTFPLKHTYKNHILAYNYLPNYCLSRAIENTIGILATKFRRPIIARPEKVIMITVCYTII